MNVQFVGAHLRSRHDKRHIGVEEIVLGCHRQSRYDSQNSQQSHKKGPASGIKPVQH